MTVLRCSFCNRTVSEVKQIISGPNPAHPVTICNECVEVCAGILRDGMRQGDAGKRFALRRTIYDGLPFTIAVLISAGLIFCVRAYFTGGVSNLEETVLVLLLASGVAILLSRSLRRLMHVSK